VSGIHRDISQTPRRRRRTEIELLLLSESLVGKVTPVAGVVGTVIVSPIPKASRCYDRPQSMHLYSAPGEVRSLWRQYS